MSDSNQDDFVELWVANDSGTNDLLVSAGMLRVN